MGSIMGTRAQHPIQKSIVIPIKVFVNIYDLSVYGSNCFR